MKEQTDLTPSEAALCLSMTYAAVLRLGFLGKLEMRRAEDGRTWRISQRSVEALKAQRRAADRAPVPA